MVAAAADAGALGVLDLGRDPAAAARALTQLARRVPGGFGVRVPDGVEVPALPAEADVVMVSSARLGELAGLAPRAVLVQVTSLAEARAAVAAGAEGIIAKGSESGGRSATTPRSYCSSSCRGRPRQARLGPGRHRACTAAACVAGGAAGVVLDCQLALVRESAARRGPAAIASMDGSETSVVGGHRVYTRPDLPVAQLAGAGLARGRRRPARRRRPRGDLLPMGADAAFAALAHRFETVGGVVRGVRAAIAAPARAGRPAGAAGPGARSPPPTAPATRSPRAR